MTHDETFHYRLIPELARCLGTDRFLELGCSANSVSRQMLKLGLSTVIGVDSHNVPDLSYGKFFKMTTQEFLAGMVKEYAPYDMVFIDADHDLKAVEADFWGVMPYVVDDGIILLHDTYPVNSSYACPTFSGTAYQFARDLKNAPGIQAIGEFCTLPVSPGLTIFRKRKNHVPWEENEIR